MSKFWSRLEKYENIRKFLSRSIFFLFILFILVMILPPAECIYMYFTGTKVKFELLKFIGWGMSGFIATLGVVGLLRRAAALDEQNKMTEKGHIQERFKVATEHLGNQRDSVRIAAFYEFYRLAQIESEPDLLEHIFDILCAHLRYTTKHKDYKKNHEPTEEVQSLLDVLFKPKNKDILIFRGLKANLAEVHLQGANLRDANLQKAKMQGVNLQYANLRDANLQGTHLQKEYMIEEDVEGVDGVDMQEADMQGADLLDAQINEKTTLLPDNWDSVVKQYDTEDRGKIPGVKVMDDKGKFKKYY